MNDRRRLFLQQLGSGALALSLGAAATTHPALADDSRLDPESDSARALGYLETAPNSSKRCSTCQLFKGAASASWGRCGIFPGKRVKATGWCSAWSA